MSHKHCEALISKLNGFKRNSSSREEIPCEQNLAKNLAKNFTSRRVYWQDSQQDHAEILAARNCAFWWESWQDSWQDRTKILAAGNFTSRRESCWDPAGIPAGNKNPIKIAAGSHQDPSPVHSISCKQKLVFTVINIIHFWSYQQRWQHTDQQQ